MTTVWLLLRGDVRRRWRALPGLALILGLAGGVVVTAAGGAAPDTGVQVFASPDGSLGVTGDRVKITAGRMFGSSATGAAVPVRTALAGTALAVGAVAAALVFAASLLGLVATLGSGAVVATSLLSGITADTGCTGRQTCYNFLLLRLRPGASADDIGATLLARAAQAHCPPGQCTVTADQRPGEIRDYAGIRDTPLALGAVLALLAAATLVHVLRTAVRRRRRDLAVLKALGFTRGQVRAAVAWNATALAAAALLAGVPLGVVAGRWAWAVFAGAAGVGASATVDVPLVLLAVPAATLLLANLAAAAPGRAAARLRPADVLRTE